MKNRKDCRVIQKQFLLSLLAVASLLPFTLRSSSAADDVQLKKGAPAHKWAFTSKAFQEGQKIPKQYTGEGKNISPPLNWTAPPAQTKSLALICDDPDAPAGTWVHWVMYGIPAMERELSEAVPTEKKLKNGAEQGLNSDDKEGYEGPLPPPGKLHRYFFKLYALDDKVNLKPGTKKAQLIEAMKDHVLAEAKLMGTYER